MRYEAVSVYINNEPNRAMVREARWGGRTVLDCGVDSPENMDRAQSMATLMNIGADWMKEQVLAKMQTLCGR